jgi:hypothetical protein
MMDVRRGHKNVFVRLGDGRKVEDFPFIGLVGHEEDVFRF